MSASKLFELLVIIIRSNDVTNKSDILYNVLFLLDLFFGLLALGLELHLEFIYFSSLKFINYWLLSFTSRLLRNSLLKAFSLSSLVAASSSVASSALLIIAASALISGVSLTVSIFKLLCAGFSSLEFLPVVSRHLLCKSQVSKLQEYFRIQLIIVALDSINEVLDLDDLIAWDTDLLKLSSQRILLNLLFLRLYFSR